MMDGKDKLCCTASWLWPRPAWAMAPSLVHQDMSDNMMNGRARCYAVLLYPLGKRLIPPIKVI